MATSTGRNTTGPDATGAVRPGLPAWWAWVALATFTACINGLLVAVDFSGSDISEGLLLLTRGVSLALTWQWLEAEGRPYRQTYPLDMGLFLYMVGFALLPYYLWRNQRWRGLLKLAGLIAVWIVSYSLAAGAAYLATG